MVKDALHPPKIPERKSVGEMRRDSEKISCPKYIFHTSTHSISFARETKVILIMPMKCCETTKFHFFELFFLLSACRQVTRKSFFVEFRVQVLRCCSSTLTLNTAVPRRRCAAFSSSSFNRLFRPNRLCSSFVALLSPPPHSRFQMIPRT